MAGSISVNPFRSRLGREMYVLAAVLAGLPIVVIATLSFRQIETTLLDSTAEALQRDVRAYGFVVYERLLGAAGALSSLDASTPASGIDSVSAFALFDVAGNRLAGTLDPARAAYGTYSEIARPKLILEESPRGPLTYVVSATDGGFAVGLVDPEYVWGDELPPGTAHCVLAPEITTPIFCSEPAPSGLHDLVYEAPATRRDFRWQAEDTAYLSSYWELFTRSAFDGPLLRLVTSRDEALALEPLATFRNLYVPAGVVILGFTLLAAGFYARRTLNPLAQLLSLSRRFAARDFAARATLGRDDEFADLEAGLHSMAHDLSRQFRARETLSEIDRQMLSGSDIAETIEFVLRRLADHTPCAFASVVTLKRGSALLGSIATTTPQGTLDGREQILVPGALMRWLEAHALGAFVTPAEDAAPWHVLLPPETQRVFVVPVGANEKPAGAVIVGIDTPESLDEMERQVIRDLAGGLAVAIESVERAAELHRKAYFDDLTGLPNREFCLDRLDHAIRQAEHLDSSIAVMVIDLDGFKAINDSLGHVAGDEVIRQAAYRLTACVRDAGTIGRLGGDEFALVIPFPVGDADPRILADKVLEAVGESFFVGNSEVHLSASIGVARYPDDGDTRVEILRKADTAMYEAKESGRGCSVDYAKGMGVKVGTRLRLETELRHALERDELALLFQPQVDLRSGRVVSAEALLRWTHPELGSIPPDEFIPIAEETGHINVIGGWVLAHALGKLAEWRQAGHDVERIAVNVSADQFRRAGFVHDVRNRLDDLGLEPCSLELELTESVFVGDLQKARTSLDEIKRLGVSISIDDFGTGYSSLGYLKHLTFDVVKVDRAFIKDLPLDRDSAAIVNAVEAMSHTLGKKVVAEGIETHAQLVYLRDLGIDLGQGYLFGKPMPAEAFADLLEKQEGYTTRRQRAYGGAA